MHFWIDKRSQACGFNGRHGVPASLASGRSRRNKSMVTPVHRLHSIESPAVAQQLRRPYQQHLPQSRPESNQIAQCQSPVLSHETVSGSVTSGPTQTLELDTPVYLDAPLEGALDTVPHAQLMRLGGLTKYGMWVSFGLTTVSVAATKFYVDHQGTFEILLLCTLGVLSAGLLVSCALTACKKSNPQFINIQPSLQQPTATEVESTEVMVQQEIFISPMSNSISQQITIEQRPSTQEFEQPPPPYHIAILLPLKETCADFPPPSYENVVR